ncbi:hypothetical protein EIP91_000577, partial [Steccherinum ochraceum]
SHISAPFDPKSASDRISTRLTLALEAVCRQEEELRSLQDAREDNSEDQTQDPTRLNVPPPTQYATRYHPDGRAELASVDWWQVVNLEPTHAVEWMQYLHSASHLEVHELIQYLSAIANPEHEIHSTGLLVPWDAYVEAQLPCVLLDIISEPGMFQSGSKVFKSINYSVEILTTVLHSLLRLMDGELKSRSHRDLTCLKGMSSRIGRFSRAMWNQRQRIQLALKHEVRTLPRDDKGHPISFYTFSVMSLMYRLCTQSHDFPKHLMQKISRTLRDDRSVGKWGSQLMYVCTALLTNAPRIFSSVMLPEGSGIVPSLLIHCQRQLCSSTAGHAEDATNMTIENIFFMLATKKTRAYFEHQIDRYAGKLNLIGLIKRFFVKEIQDAELETKGGGYSRHFLDLQLASVQRVRLDPSMAEYMEDVRRASARIWHDVLHSLHSTPTRSMEHTRSRNELVHAWQSYGKLGGAILANPEKMLCQSVRMFQSSAIPSSSSRPEDADDEYIKRFAGPSAGKIVTDCLFRFDEPVSPHLAARLALKSRTKVHVPADDQFAIHVSSHIRTCAQKTRSFSHLYAETAGGVHSPSLTGTSQLDAYRPLLLPTILVGDSRLGGISATISSYESLIVRGYTVDAILLFRDEYYRNWEYLQDYFAERQVHVSSVDAPPPKHADDATNAHQTEEYYQRIVPSTGEGDIFRLQSHLNECHGKRLQDLSSMPRRTLDSIWWPFVQHSHFSHERDVTVIDSASSDAFSVYNGHRSNLEPESSLLEPHFDGSASWWTQGLGHAHPALSLAAARAAGRYGHVMFPQATHLPALKLAERLIQSGPGKGWASRAFFSDDGSTGMEVAIKMALRAFAVRASGGLDSRVKRRDLGVLGLKGSYHGDTIGAMDACEEGVYTSEWHEAKGYWFDPPTVSIRKGQTVISLPDAIASEVGAAGSFVDTPSLHWTYDVEGRLHTALADTYRSYIKRTLGQLRERNSITLAALILEPIVMGAGGMIFVDPLFQRVLVDAVRSIDGESRPAEWSGMPVIFDEVFVGMYRLGLQSTIPLLGVSPDISVHAKVLTGGLVPLAVTLASDSIFKAFYSDKKADALLHGHSYTAYPVGCEVANETLKIIDRLSESESWQQAKRSWEETEKSAEVARPDDKRIWSFWEPDFVNVISHLDVVSEVMTLGTVLSIKVKDNSSGYQSHSAQNILAGIKEIASERDTSSLPGGAPFAINYRTLGDVAYFMLSLNTSLEVTRAVQKRILDTLRMA